VILLRDNFVAAALQMPPTAPSSSAPMTSAMMKQAAAATCMRKSVKLASVVCVTYLLCWRGEGPSRRACRGGQGISALLLVRAHTHEAGEGA